MAGRRHWSCPKQEAPTWLRGSPRGPLGQRVKKMKDRGYGGGAVSEQRVKWCPAQNIRNLWNSLLYPEILMPRGHRLRPSSQGWDSWALILFTVMFLILFLKTQVQIPRPPQPSLRKARSLWERSSPFGRQHGLLFSLAHFCKPLQDFSLFFSILHFPPPKTHF